MESPPADASGDASPESLLDAYHSGVAATLDRLEANLAQPGHAPAPGTHSQEAVGELLAVLDAALGVHMFDEEKEIFPAILAAAQSPARRAQTFELVSTALVEHRWLSERLNLIREALAGAGTGASNKLPVDAAREFVERFRAHIEREERELPDLLRAVAAGHRNHIAATIARRNDELRAAGRTPQRARPP